MASPTQLYPFHYSHLSFAMVKMSRSRHHLEIMLKYMICCHVVNKGCKEEKLVSMAAMLMTQDKTELAWVV